MGTFIGGLIVAGVVLYAAWIIRRKVRDIKEGNIGCGGNCANCSGCNSRKER